MSNNRTFPLELLLATAVSTAFHAFSSHANAQELRQPAGGTVALQTGAESTEVTALRRDFDEVARLLRAQQEQIEQQSLRLEQLQRELATRPAFEPPTQVQGIPAAYPGIRATASSFSAASLASEPSYIDCGPCNPCDTPCGRPCDTGRCDPGPRFDIGGQYRLMYNASNFDFHEATITDAQESQTFFNQRFRTWLEFHTSELVSAYMQVEIGHVFWGEAPEFPKTYPGPFSPPGDRVGIELRRGYLTYGNQDAGILRAGIQDWHDAFGESYTLGTFGAVDDYDSFASVLANSIWDFNVGGLAYAGPAPWLPGLNLNAGAFALWEGERDDADDAFLLALDLDRPVSDDSSVGFSVYYLSDRGTYSYPITLPGGGAFAYDSAWDLWIGLRANTLLLGIPARGFAIYNTGQREELGALPRFEHNDVALKLELGPVSFGPGKVSFQTLYSTGDGNPDETRRDGFRTIAQSERDNFGSQGYWSYLVLTSPHPPSDVNDLGVGLQNRGLGLFTVQGKYDYPIYGRLSGTIAAGWLRSDARNPVSRSSDMGTELANMFAFDFGGGLTLDFGAAVLFTGDFYKPAPAAPSPDTLWEAFARLQLEF